MDKITFNVDAFWSRLKTLTKERGMRIEQLCVAIETPPQNMLNKKCRKTYPTLEELFRISRLLGVSVEQLVLGDDTDNLYQRQINELRDRLSRIRDIAMSPSPPAET